MEDDVTGQPDFEGVQVKSAGVEGPSGKKVVEEGENGCSCDAVVGEHGLRSSITSYLKNACERCPSKRDGDTHI